MPELPEVETIIRVLEKELYHDIITSVDLRYPPLLEEKSQFGFDVLINKQFIGFSRRGKYLCFEFSDGYYWVVHLRMEGKFHLYNDAPSPDKHTHLVLKTDQRTIHYWTHENFREWQL